VHAKASGFKPDSNQVILEDGTKVNYDYLVVAPGIQSSEHCFDLDPLTG